MSSRFKELERRVGTIAFGMAEKSFLKRDALSAERLGARLGNLIFKVDKKHRNRTLSNLELAMPELSEERRLEIAQEMFRHFGRVTADFMRAEVRSDEEVWSSLEIVGAENAEAAKAVGKGILACTGHFGNWERMGPWLRSHGKTVAVVARDANEVGLNQIVTRKRESQGLDIIPRGKAAREIISRLRNDQMIAILADQNNGESFLPFFGKPTGTVLGPAVMHLRTGAPMMPFFGIWLGPGQYRVEILPPIIGNPGDTPEDIMTRYNAALESVVRRYPAQWLWMHDRWKSARQRNLL